MSDMRVAELLAEMRALKLQAQGKLPGLDQGAGAVAGSEFGAMLKQSIQSVNQSQQKATDLAAAFEAGDNKVDLSDVMVAMQKASISFQAMTQVRNKLVAAYHEIMSMPI
jgi:flagellar hook-basal body complex protein FliE